MPYITRQGVTSQDLKHRPQRFGCKIRLLKPHAVLMPSQGPHRSRVALKRGDATLEELLHHLGRSHAKLPQPLESAPDKGELGAHELLVTPT